MRFEQGEDMPVEGTLAAKITNADLDRPFLTVFSGLLPQQLG